ncbi:MAG: T9SS type A sorting domain-containing protein [Bacteroidetes bacterium]|nr:T9SS type A sorting domain-containing protein [Bacteroidota bacterium]
MMRSCTIDSSLTLSGGLFQSDSIISLKSPVTTTGSSANSFIDGPVKKTGNTTFVFPIGDQGKYRPLAISAPSQATDAFSAQYFYSPQQAGTSTDTTIGEISPCNYWDLQRKTGNSNVYVTLSWDSIGCCVLDSSNIKVINWNNSVWKDLGKGSLGGNANTGQITSALVPYTYGLITIGTDPIIILDIFPVVDRNNTDEGWYHSFVAEEPIYGYNGSNTIEPGKSWQDYANVDLLKEKNVKSLRIPSGTTANYWDWRAGWFLKEHELPEGWLYEKEKYKAANPGGNEMINIKPHVDELGASPVYLFNMLTSDFHYQLASLYRAHQINLPVKYVELGNEFYLNEAHHRNKFPNASDYALACNDWTSQLKAISPFADVKVAVIGCDEGDDSPGRRRLWLERVLANLDPQAQIDAITIHQYYGNGLGSQPFSGSNANLKTMLSRPFKEIERLKGHELLLINSFNEGSLSAYPLKTWITEFNLRTSGQGTIGTWAHGLFHAAMALSYLESQNINSIITHTMSSDVIFGNIFDSQDGFSSISGGNYPSSTNQYEFTALGAAYNQIAKAARYATDAYKVNFTGIDDQDLPYLYNTGVNTTSVRVVYAWLFESAAGNELIVLNLGGNSFHMYLDDIFQSVGLSTHPIRYERLISVDITGGITGSPVTSIPPTPVGYDNYYLITSNELPVSTNSNGTFVPISNYSLTRISQKLPGFILNVTDDHICTSTSTEPSTTSIIITGGVSPYTIVETSPNSSTSYSQPDSVIAFTAHQTNTGVYTITVTDANNSTATATITVDARPIVNVTSNPTSGNCNTSFQLTASINPAPSNYEYYTFLWTPSTGLETFSGSCNPGGVTPMCSTIVVNPEQTTSYQVYVFDGTCWSRSSEYEILRAPVNHVDIGEDLTVCSDGVTGPTIKLTAILDSDPTITISGTYNWTISGTSGNIPNCSTDCEILLPATIGETYTITLSLLESGFPCSIPDVMEVYVTECCDCISNSISLNPSQGTTFENHVFSSQLSQQMLNPYFLKANDDFEPIYDIKGWIPVVYPNTSQTPNSNTICINGDLIIDRDIAFRDVILRMNENSKIRILDDHLLILQGCSIKSCDRTIPAAMWDGIEAERLLDKREPRLFIDQSSTNRTSISEAKSAITLKNGAEYIIENIDFTNNYIDIDVANYGNVIQQNPLTTTKNLFSIHSNTYSSSGNLLMAPYDNVHKFAAIRLNDVERFVLGDSTSATLRNEISKSMFGVQFYNSGFECYNTGFDDINIYEGWSSRGIAGSAIFGSQFNSGADRNILIGATLATSTTKNVFRNSENGIYIKGDATLKVFNNLFGDDDVDFRIRGLGINAIENRSKQIYITRSNVFDNYNVGARVFDIGAEVICHIGENVFNNAALINTTSFEGTAIHVSNPLAWRIPAQETFLNINPRVRIFNNIIGSNSQVEQARIGIFSSLIWKPAIEENEINFHRDNQTVFPNGIGIWMQGCALATIRSNSIQQVGTQHPLMDNLIGILSDNNIVPCISSHDQAGGRAFKDLGYGVQFRGNHGWASFSLNEFDNCESGVLFDLGWIGTQGNANRTDDNRWIDNSTARVDGITSFPGTFAPWYFDPLLDDEFEPNGSAVSTINSTSIDDPILCPLLQTAAARNQSYGYVIGDSARYDESYAQAFTYNGKISTYKALRLDTTMLVLDDNADDSFVEFYQEFNQSNVQHFDNVTYYAQNGDYALALETLSAIDDTNSQESALKSVHYIYSNRKYSAIVYTSTDTTYLDSVALCNSLITGDASFMSRNILFKEVHDAPLESNLRMMNPTLDKADNSLNYFIYPNPTRQTCTIINNNQLFNGWVMICDIQNRILSQFYSNGTFDVDRLNDGTYFIHLQRENDNPVVLKLVVRH